MFFNDGLWTPDDRDCELLIRREQCYCKFRGRWKKAATVLQAVTDETLSSRLGALAIRN
jgi:hypothetical protein